jgi:MoaA/NifB/PqqE/SkfB family radical SAM enzyme
MSEISKLKVIKNVVFSKNEPVSLVHFITNRCNARCSFCFIDFDNKKTFQNELNLDQIDKLTKNLGSSLINVSFTGGEPFGRKDIVEIAKSYIKNSTIESIYITTNGSLPKRVENFIEEINKFDDSIELNFQISIDHFPERHDKIRKIKGLFEQAIKTYKLIRNFNIKNVNSSVAITVSKENCNEIKEIHDYLYNECDVKYLKAILVRDEGVYKTDDKNKNDISKAYDWLTIKIIENQNIHNGNYNNHSLQGKIHNQKDLIAIKLIKQTVKENKFISPCHASSLFGVITAQGDVYPCEILEDKKIGSLLDYDMNFMSLWNSKINKDLRKSIIKDKCFCTYECGMSFNILGNYRYYPELMISLFK